MELPFEAWYHLGCPRSFTITSCDLAESELKMGWQCRLATPRVWSLVWEPVCHTASMSVPLSQLSAFQVTLSQPTLSYPLGTAVLAQRSGFRVSGRLAVWDPDFQRIKMSWVTGLFPTEFWRSEVLSLGIQKLKSTCTKGQKIVESMQKDRNDPDQPSLWGPQVGNHMAPDAASVQISATCVWFQRVFTPFTPLTWLIWISWGGESPKQTLISNDVGWIRTPNPYSIHRYFATRISWFSVLQPFNHSKQWCWGSIARCMKSNPSVWYLSLQGVRVKLVIVTLRNQARHPEDGSLKVCLDRVIKKIFRGAYK